MRNVIPGIYILYGRKKKEEGFDFFIIIIKIENCKCIIKATWSISGKYSIFKIIYFHNQISTIIYSTIDLGDDDTADIYVDGDTNATGYSTLTATARHVAATADTLDVLVLSAASTAGKIRVWAVLCDVAGVDETDRQSDAQHDTAQ